MIQRSSIYFFITTIFLFNISYGQVFSQKGTQFQQNQTTNNNESLLLQTACAHDDAACKQGGRNEYNKTTETEKRSVNKYYGRLNQRSTPVRRDCFQIPAANENQADHHQALTQNKIFSDFEADGSENSQVNAQRALRRSHVLKQDTALIQGTGWGAATVCQGTLLAFGLLPSNIDNSLDFAASSGLALHHSKKYRRNVAYSNNLEDLVKKLPDSGDCSDPSKNRTCYCSRPENLNDASCLPSEYVSRQGSGSTTIGCVDSRGSVDPKCECATNNTCADAVYKDLFEQNGFGKFARHEAFTVPSELFRGKLDPSLHQKVDGARAKLGFSLLRNSLSQVEKRLAKVYKPRKLTKEQRAEARFFKKDGIPPLLANYFASSPDDPNARDKFKAFLKQDPKKTKFENKIVEIASVQKNKGNEFASYNRSKAKTITNQPEEENSEIAPEKVQENKLSAQKERELASLLNDARNLDGQIHKDGTKDIFRIISNRYRVSSPRRLELSRN